MKQRKNSTPEIKGLDHPAMTPALAKELLPDGKFPISLDLAFRIGLLCNPMQYDSIPAGQLKAIAAELNSSLDEALRKAQQKEA